MKKAGKVDLELENLEYQLNLIEEHNSYLIRVKLYQKTGMYQSKELLRKILAISNQLDELILDYHLSSLKSYYIEIMECINIILCYEEYNLDLDELERYAILIRELLEDFHDFILNVDGQSLEDIQEIEILSEEREFEKIRHSYEDNIDQILKSFAWKEYEAKILQSENEEEFNQFSHLLSQFNSAKITGSHLKNREDLETLARLSASIKDLLGLNFESVFDYIPLLDSLCRLFTNNSDPITGEEVVPIRYLRESIDHLVNTSRVEWLGNFYHSIREDTPQTEEDRTHIIFAKRFYKVTSDPREDFLWTMNYYSRLTDDKKIVNLSYKVANLTSMVLTIVDHLRNLEQTSLAESIINLEEISYKDAISDLSEIYHMQNNWEELMKNALNSKLSTLKDIILQITQFNEIADEVMTMFQFIITKEHELYPITYDRLNYIISNY